MTIVLLQARDDNDPMLRHEIECFEARCGLPSDRFRSLNLAHTNPTDWDISDAKAIMVGGSGDYSVVHGGFEWHQPMLDLMHTILARKLPMFASCFGFQALVQALGGELVADAARAQVGTFRMTLTHAGQEDSLFGQLPETFDAQLGHNDSAAKLPAALIHLASSEDCEYQAVRVADRPVWASQFHPELSKRDNITRYKRYLTNYAPKPLTPAEAEAHARAIHRDTPEANGLLRRFLASL